MNRAAVLALVAIGLLLFPVAASAGEEIEIIRPRTPALSGPGESFRRLVWVGLGNHYDLLGEENGWYRIQLFSGEYGWVPVEAARLLRGTVSIELETRSPIAEPIAAMARDIADTICTGAGLMVVDPGREMPVTDTLCLILDGFTRPRRGDRPDGVEISGSVGFASGRTFPFSGRYGEERRESELRPGLEPAVEALARAEYPYVLAAALAERFNPEAAIDGVALLTVRTAGEIQRSALAAVSRLPGARSVELLTGAMAAAGAADRRRLAETLGNCGGGAAIPVLLTSLRDTDAGVRTATFVALRRLTGQDAGRTPAAWDEWWADSAPWYAADLELYESDHDTLTRGVEKTYWAAARTRDSITGYRGFLRAFPDGQYADSAAGCLMDAEWRRLEHIGIILDFRRFLGRYPDSPRRDEAERRIMELEVAEIGVTIMD